MSTLDRNRVLACAGVRMCKAREDGEDNNRRGQDKSDGPAGVYAVVVVAFFAAFAALLGAVPALNARQLLTFSGTSALPVPQ